MNHLIDFISVSFFIHNFRLRQHTYFMKKQKHLPDFTRLCKPEQNTIQNILSLMIFFFFTGSVCGYVWEVLIFLVKEGTFRNRGFLYGPWLPVYGIGAVLFSVILSPRELLPDSSGKYKKNNPVTNVIKLRWPIKILASEMMLGSFYFVINAWHMIRNVRPLSLLNDNEVAKAAPVIKNILIARR